MTMRDVNFKDLEEILELNNNAVPGVNELEFEELRQLMVIADYFKIIESDQIDGFLIGLDHEAYHDGINYKWHQLNFNRFFYVDRVVVGDHAQGTGLGNIFYDDIKDYCRKENIPYIACEIYLEPANHQSMRFHNRHDFVQYEMLDYKTHRMAMMYHRLDLPVFEGKPTYKSRFHRFFLRR